MPYIKDKARRIELDYIVEHMHYMEVQPDGDLNYILYAYAKRHVAKKYNSLKNYMAELTECVAEIRRRLMVPREEEAIEENGDVE